MQDAQTVADANLADGAQTNAASATIDEYCAAMGTHYFRWLSLCYGSEQYGPDNRDRFVMNEEQCEPIRRAVKEKRVRFDEQAAGSCVATISKRMDCDKFEFPGPGCEGVIIPLVKLGETCTDAFFYLGSPGDCAEGTCHKDEWECPGTCKKPVGEGKSCKNATCADGLYCHIVADTYTCKPRAKEDETCSTSGAGPECDEKLACNVPAGKDEGKCVVPVPFGEKCSSTSVCDRSLCLDGVCRSKSNKGEECLHRWTCFDPYVCVDTDGPGAKPKTCEDKGAVGDFCEPMQGRECTSSYCNPEGRCQALPALDEPCLEKRYCAEGLWCMQTSTDDPGTCKASGAAGASCKDLNGGSMLEDACQEGLFCMDDERCHPIGKENDPCRWYLANTCEPGLFCARETFTCKSRAKQGEVCNPLFHGETCVAGLACTCGTETGCGSHSPFPTPTDTCEPVQGTDALCRRNDECESGTCAGIETGAESGKCAAPTMPTTCP